MTDPVAGDSPFAPAGRPCAAAADKPQGSTHDVPDPSRSPPPLPVSIVPLGEVPDPMFALGMMGDGHGDRAEPPARWWRPAPPTVVSVHRRGHAVKLKAEGGAEILIHVGLEAVALRGQGLVPAVKEGDRRRGLATCSIRFDLVAADGASAAW